MSETCQAPDRPCCSRHDGPPGLLWHGRSCEPDGVALTPEDWRRIHGERQRELSS